MTSQTKAEAIVGSVEWQSEVHGLCKCPGEHVHSNNTRVKDTTVFIDSVPTIFCWHSSCQAIRDEMNYRLRRAVLDDLKGGSYVPSTMATIGQAAAKMEGGMVVPPRIIQRDPEAEMINRIKVIAESNKARYLAHYNWDPADMFEQSPHYLLGGNPTQEYQLFLSLFSPTDTIWIGDVKDSGNHPQNFRTMEEWEKLVAPAGNFTTGSIFKPGSISRANENATRKYLVVESDELTKDQMGGLFQLMRDLFKMKLYAVVDTAGKSLHGWFEAPPKPEWEKQLKAFLVPVGCDPATFKPSQPVRIPGAKREEKTQSLLWFCKEGR